MKKYLLFPLLYGLMVACAPQSVAPETTGPIPSTLDLSGGGSRDQKMPDVQAWNGYLVFSTPKVFEAYQAKFQNASPAELEAWEQQFKFTSLRTLFNRLLSEETAYQERNDAQRIAGGNKYCNYFYQNQDIFIIDPATQFFRTRVALRSMEKFVNRDGLVQVAGHLFQYGERVIKIIQGADPKKIPLLANTYQTDKQQGIIVLPISQNQPIQTQSRQNRITVFGSVSDRRVSCTIGAYTYEAPIYDLNATPTYVCIYDGGLLPIGCFYQYPIIGYQTRSNAYTWTGVQRQNSFQNWVNANADYIQTTVQISFPNGTLGDNIDDCLDCSFLEVIVDRPGTWAWASSNHQVSHGGQSGGWSPFIN
jgi:hypothetical protein